ncbi:MAG TPA: class I SAM-dependent methyltransferase [Anaerolineales bacterium]|nr:class I SAM-dependent methyltransferase [Anaerolineales bacterium]
MTMHDLVTTGEDFEYRGLLAATWDLFRGDTSNWEDRFFFRDMIREYGEPALDVGCGTGRLLLDFMADGIDIDGVDNSPEMLAQCMEKARRLGLTPMVYQQAMEALNLPRRYQTIIVPSSTFQLLTDLASARYAMERFYAHLKPDGVLVMPFMLIWKEGEPLHGEWKQTGEKVRPEDGALARRWSRADYDLENQLEHTEDRYELSLNGEVIAAEHHRRSPATRWYTHPQATRLYGETGLTDICLFSEFTHNPASEADQMFCVLGEKG